MILKYKKTLRFSTSIGWEDLMSLWTFRSLKTKLITEWKRDSLNSEFRRKHDRLRVSLLAGSPDISSSPSNYNVPTTVKRQPCSKVCVSTCTTHFFVGCMCISENDQLANASVRPWFSDNHRTKTCHTLDYDSISGSSYYTPASHLSRCMQATVNF